MRRRLMIMRHAKSSWRSQVPTDHERPLNTRGRRDAARVGKRLAKLGCVPDHVVGSDSRRTQETWERMQKYFPEARVSFTRALPSAGGDEPRPASDAEGAALPTRHSVLGVVALRGWQIRVHHAAALRAVAHRRVPPPVVHVLAGSARALHHHADETCPRAIRRRRESASTPIVSHRFSKLKGQLRSRLVT